MTNGIILNIENNEQLLDKLRVVVLDNPISQWNTSFVRQLFGDNIAFKWDGYQKGYSSAVLPFDTGDFIATHLLVCLKDNEFLKPIYGYKSITLNRAKEYHFQFPAVSVVNSSQSREHIEANLSIIQDAERLGKSIAYSGSRTIHPDISKNREFRSILRDIFQMIHYCYHQDYQVDWEIAAAVTRFQADKQLFNWGFEPFKKETSLPPIELPFLNNEKALMMVKNKPFEKSMIEPVSKYLWLWENRMTWNAEEEKQAA